MHWILSFPFFAGKDINVWFPIVLREEKRVYSVHTKPVSQQIDKEHLK